MQNNDYGPFEPLPPDTPAPPPRRKRGPTPKPASEQRINRIAVYLNDAEIKVVSGFSQLSGTCPAAYLRKAALKTPPVIIPELNQLAWQQLSSAVSNLNQIAKRINSNDLSALEEVRTTLIRFRVALTVAQK